MSFRTALAGAGLVLALASGHAVGSEARVARGTVICPSPGDLGAAQAAVEALGPIEGEKVAARNWGCWWVPAGQVLWVEQWGPLYVETDRGWLVDGDISPCGVRCD